jgi:hypothetical protein
MSRRILVLLLLLTGTERAAAGENANLAAAELLHAAAPVIAETLQARFPDAFAALLPDAAGLAMLPGTGASAADIQAQAAALVAAAVAGIERRDADFVLRAPAASLRPVIAADRALMQAAREVRPALCATLLGSQEGAVPPGPVLSAQSARTAALLAAIADARDHPVTPRRATPEDYTAFTEAAGRRGVAIAEWAVLAPGRLDAAEPAQVCSAMISVDAEVLALPDDQADRILADMAAVLTRQGN